MKYGTLTQAKYYHDNGKIDEWLQLFLRNDGKNLALADGLLLEEREYLGLIKLNMSYFKNVKAGTPEYLTQENDIEYFFWIVDHMKSDFGNWDVPPLIVEFRDDDFHVNDGRHRLEMYRQMGIEEVNVVLWTTGDENKEKLQAILD